MNDETFFCSYHTDRLVVAAVTVFQFVYFCASRFREQLVTHTDSEDRKFFVLHSLADVLYCSIASVWVTRTV